MNNNEKTKKAFLFLMMLTVTLASSGCGMLEINQKRASQIVVTNLEEKYGGDFEVRTVERKNLGVNAFKDHVYVMNVYSEELDELFTVQIFRDGTNMSDNYEEHLYKKEIEKEMASIPKCEDGWTTEELEFRYRYYPNQQKSKDFNDYKRNKDKLVLRISVRIDDTSDRVSNTLFEYIDNLQNHGYRIILNVYYGNKREIIKILEYDEMISESSIREAMDRIEADDA